MPASFFFLPSTSKVPPEVVYLFPQVLDPAISIFYHVILLFCVP